MTNTANNNRHGLITPCFNKFLAVTENCTTLNQIFVDGQPSMTLEFKNGRSLKSFSGSELYQLGIDGLVNDQQYFVECDGANVAFIWDSHK